MNAQSGLGRSTSRAAMREREDAVGVRLSALAPALDGEPDPAWQATTHARLVAMAAVRTPEPVPASRVRRLLAARERSPWRTRLTAGVAGAATAITGLATVVALSSDASPGDALYGVKRGTEQTQLTLAGDARGMTLLGFASTRLGELRAVLDDDADVGVLRDTLATMDDQTTHGAAWLTRRAVDRDDDAPLDALDGWVAGQSAGLDGLQSRMPGVAQPRAGASADLLARVDERVDALRVALQCPSGPATSGTDALGPVPGTCTADAPAPPAGGSPQATVPEAPGTPGTAPTPSSPGTPGGTDGGADVDSGSEGDPDGGAGPPARPTPGPPTRDLPAPELPVPLPDPLPQLPSLPLPPPSLPRLGDLLPGSSGAESDRSSTATPRRNGILPCVSLPPLLQC